MHNSTSQALTTGRDQTRRQRRSSRRPTFIWRKRDAEDSQYFGLQLDVLQLQQQIQRLQQARTLLQQQSLNQCFDDDGSCVRIVTEYHRMIALVGNAVPINHILRFLAKTVDEFAVINGQRGRHEIARQGRSRGFAGVKIAFGGTQVVCRPDATTAGKVVVRANSSFATVITQEVVENMFPHLLAHPHVVAKLVNQPLEGSQSAEFTFDCKTSMIVRMDEVTDMFGAFAKLLPNPKELALVFPLQSEPPFSGAPQSAYANHAGVSSPGSSDSGHAKVHHANTDRGISPSSASKHAKAQDRERKPRASQGGKDKMALTSILC